MNATDDIARKIGALLAKAERTDNPHEAEAYTRKAEALMVKAGIDEAMARAAAGGEVRPERIIERRVRVAVNTTTLRTWWPRSADATRPCDACGTDLPARRYPTTKNPGERGGECRPCRDARAAAKQRVNAETNAYNREHVTGWHSVARALGADTFYMGNYSSVYLVGHESDVARIEALVVSLKTQATLAMWSWWASHPDERRYTWSSADATKARRDFMVSFYAAVARRLRDQSKQVEDATPGAALVLRDKAAELRDHMDCKNLRHAKGRSYNGSAAGARAGMSANLGGDRLGGGHRAIG